MDRWSISCRQLSILWSYLDIILLLFSYLYLIILGGRLGSLKYLMLGSVDGCEDRIVLGNHYIILSSPCPNRRPINRLGTGYQPLTDINFKEVFGWINLEAGTCNHYIIRPRVGAAWDTPRTHTALYLVSLWDSVGLRRDSAATMIASSGRNLSCVGRPDQESIAPRRRRREAR